MVQLTQFLNRVRFLWFVAVLAAPAWGGPLLYSNGPINGTVGGFTISPGSYISDSFVLSSDATVGDVSNIGLWLDSGNMPASLDWTISTAADGGGTVEGSGTGVSLTSSYLETTGPYDIYNASFSVGSISLAAGTYYLELQNAVGSVGPYAPVYWDENSGPSTADQNGTSISSESFEIDGVSSSTPEPATMMLLGAGLVTLAGLKRVKSTR